jgi:hypothetical protein
MSNNGEARKSPSRSIVVDGRSIEIPTPPRSPSGGSARWPEAGWGGSRASAQRSEKQAMGEYFAEHDFLVEGNPETDPRKPTAVILVNGGTTPSTVVEAALNWIENKGYKGGRMNITWFTPGSLATGVLLRFIERNNDLRTAAELFLFPGRVDRELQSVNGDEPVAFAKELKLSLNYSLLSANSFNLVDGSAHFFFNIEINLQRACALKEAEHKFLFLDSKKFGAQGFRGYTLDELLETSQKVTVYTVSSERDVAIRERFGKLANHLLSVESEGQDSADVKELRLKIVATDGQSALQERYCGVLRQRVDRTI